MKIAIVSFDLWGYNQEIANTLKKQNNEVSVINSALYSYTYESIIDHLISFLKKTFFNRNIKKIHREDQTLKNILKLTHQDKILVVNPSLFSAEALNLLRNKTKEFIAFNNDSLSKVPLPKDNVHLFDRVYVFDQSDVNNKYQYAPNYIYNHKFILSFNDTKQSDVFNVQSGDKERLWKLNKIAQHLKAKDYKLNLFVKGKKRNKVDSSIQFLNSKILNLNEVNEWIYNSKIILDIVKSNQNGMSFRVMESMGLHKKLITTNQSIKDQDFYNPKNIFVIENINNFNIPENFIETPYIDIPENIYKEYTIENWINKIFYQNKIN